MKPANTVKVVVDLCLLEGRILIIDDLDAQNGTLSDVLSGWRERLWSNS